MISFNRVAQYLKSVGVDYSRRNFEVSEHDGKVSITKWNTTELGPQPDTATLEAFPDNLPQPTDDERIDAAFPQTDTGKVILEAFFELANDVRTLKGQGPLTRAQLRGWFKSKLDVQP